MIKINVNLMNPKIQNLNKLKETGKVSRALTKKEIAEEIRKIKNKIYQELDKINND